MKRALAALVLFAAACSSDADVSVPVKPAPASRHDALRDALLADPAGPATGYEIAYRAHHAPIAPAAIDGVDAALGAVEYVAATGDRSVVPALDAFIDRAEAGGDYQETTVATARLALLDVEVTRLLGEDRRARAIAHDDAIRAQAFGDFTDPSTHVTTRAYAAARGSPSLSNTANIAMLILKARLFRLTKDEVYRLEARAIYGALQTFRLAPGRYSSVDAQPDLKTDSRDVTLTADEADLAFATTLLFEITGEDRFITESDAVFDTIASLRGATGLVRYALDGALAPETCAECTYRALWALGYRRSLAGEPY